MKLRRLILPTLAALFVALTAAGLPGRVTPTQAATSTIEVTLLGEAENPAVKDGGSATARFYFNDVTRQLDYAVTVSGLSADLVTAAHIHRGAVGVNGPIVYPLSTTGFTQVSGTLTLTEADVVDLRGGNFYVNVHSKDNPGGFARGQMFLNAPEAIRASVDAAIAAWNRGDAKAFLGYWTDSGLFDAFDGETREAVASDFAMSTAETPLALNSLSNFKIQGTKVTAELELIAGIGLERTLDTFVLENGVWKISAEKDLPVGIPSNVVPVDMKLQEFSFVYERDQVTSGSQPIAFKTVNTGKQDHEIVLVKIDRREPLLELLASEDIPDGVSFIVGEGPIKPGESKNIVLVSPLSAGRYAFVCFLPDTDNVPHALKGMFSEFNVASSR